MLRIHHRFVALVPLAAAAVLLLAACSGAEGPSTTPQDTVMTVMPETELPGIAWPNFMLLQDGDAFTATSAGTPGAGPKPRTFRLHLDVHLSAAEYADLAGHLRNADVAQARGVLLGKLTAGTHDRARAMVDSMLFSHYRPTAGPPTGAGPSGRPEYDLFVDHGGNQGIVYAFRFEMDIRLNAQQRARVAAAVGNDDAALLAALEDALNPNQQEALAILHAALR